MNRGGGANSIGNRQVSRGPKCDEPKRVWWRLCRLEREPGSRKQLARRFQYGGSRGGGGVDVLAVDVEDKCSEENMISRLFSFNIPSTLIDSCVGSLLWFVPVTAIAQTQTAHQPALQSPKAFATPQQAVDELIKAAAASMCQN